MAIQKRRLGFVPLTGTDKPIYPMDYIHNAGTTLDSGFLLARLYGITLNKGHSGPTCLSYLNWIMCMPTLEI